MAKIECKGNKKEEEIGRDLFNHKEHKGIPQGSQRVNLYPPARKQIAVSGVRPPKADHSDLFSVSIFMKIPSPLESAIKKCI